MAIRITCLSCRSVYTLADHYAGKTVRCKQCEAAIVVRAAKGRAEEDVDESESERGAGARERIQTRPQAGSHAPSGSQKRARDDDEEARPRRRDRDDEEWDSPPIRRDKHGLVIGLIAVGTGLLLLLGGGVIVVVLLFAGRSENKATDFLTDAEPPPPNADAVTKTLHHLKSADPNTRREAARKLKDTLPDERRAEVVKALEPLVNDADFFTRKFAVEALGVWGNKDAVPILLRAMQNKETRGEAMKALGRLKDERAVEPIAARLEEFFDLHAAEEALKQMGPMAEKAVLARLNHHQWHTRIAVCRILKAIGTKQSIPALENAAANDFHISLQAKEAIQAIKARQ